jgi:hypothetical protein
MSTTEVDSFSAMRTTGRRAAVLTVFGLPESGVTVDFLH